ncbi:hypothetical protein M9Y10_013675 [Tritrichomonas musculus]|uniref:Transmembrane protein n=1 Tax=Tritrichomonas musculus TaxID=1915356 RepID=A0ABR2L0M2_9EUKA
MFRTGISIVTIANIVKFLFLFALYSIAEYTDAFYPNMVHSILKNTTSINPYNMTNITGFVYFSITGAHYPTIYDEYLNLTVHGAVIKRRVRYCQYNEKSGSNNIFVTSSSINTYEKKWVPEYINSSNFVDKNFVNPPLEITVSETDTFNNMKIGDLSIPSSFYTNNLVFYYFEPDELGIINFTYSNASSYFDFIQKGYFYHSASSKSSIEILDKIQSDFKRQGEKYDDILFESQSKLFEKCHPGDVRIRYLLYAPLNVTYFGYVKNFTLDVKIIDGVRFGTSMRGIKQNLESLIQIYTPDDSYDAFSDIIFFPRSILKIRIAFQIWRVIANLFIGDSLKTCYWIFAAALANLAYRSLFWDVWYLDFSIWSTTLLTFLSIGLLFGVWKIQLWQQNQN